VALDQFLVRPVTATSVPDDAAPTPVPRRRDPDGVRSWSWSLSRASAILLVVLVPLHFAVTVIGDDVGATTARSVSARLDDPTWRMLTWLTLALALVHGAIAAQAGIRRRLPGPGGLALTALICLVAGAGLASVSWVLATRWA
jgi:succinate dehydrogenase hydrophobic anchor subunit